MTIFHDNVGSLADRILGKVGRDIVLGLLLGLGEANHVANERPGGCGFVDSYAKRNALGEAADKNSSSFDVRSQNLANIDTLQYQHNLTNLRRSRLFVDEQAILKELGKDVEIFELDCLRTVRRIVPRKGRSELVQPCLNSNSSEFG